MKTTPLVVIVFPTERAPASTRFGGFARRLQKAGGLQNCDVVTVALENLAFSITESGNARVVDTATGQDMGRADLVYFKSWEAMPEEASALATYLYARGIPFMDMAAMGVGVSKLASTMRFWSKGIPMPATLYVRRADRLQQLMDEGQRDLLGERFIVKDIQGAKGKLNFYVTASEVPAILQENPDVRFICQRFIPNDGDYRIGVYGQVSRFVIGRVSGGSSHLNNTSAGGTATYIPVADMDTALLRLAEDTAKAVDLQVAGVDIIVDRETGKPYILEANQGSQIVTGAFVEENIRAFNEAMADLVRVRHVSPNRKPLAVIGRRTHVTLPELHITRAVAKIDTGAYTSTLHAEDIHLEAHEDGHQELVFDVVPGDKLEMTQSERTRLRYKDFFDQAVRSSNGQVEHRYSIKTPVVIDGQRFSAVITLSNRSEMGYPLLIGRRAIRSRFLVNVELNEGGSAVWEY